MTDPFDLVMRLTMLLFTPALILSPLAFVLFVRPSPTTEAARAEVAARRVALVVATLVALGVWLALMLAALRGAPAFALASRWSWVLFFPLWFGLALPLLRACDTAWGGPHARAAPTRTASLVDRSRESPIGRGHWVAMVLVIGTSLAAIASRGVSGSLPSGGARTGWLMALSFYGLISILTFVLVPIALRSMLREPEPLDQSGSQSLGELYAAHRNTKLRGMFWLMGMALPGFFGAVLAAAVWADGRSQEWLGYVGGYGGAALGVAGAWFGVTTAVRRVRIEEARRRLDALG